MIPVTLTEVPEAGWWGTFLGEPGAPKPKLPAEATTKFGLQMAAITPQLRATYHLEGPQQGVVITGGVIGSAAANAKINAGTVILRVRNSVVTSPDDVLKAVDDERKQMNPSVPILLVEPPGRRWVSLQFDRPS
jgi:S1-C subfamily serine protease